ncbi:MAG: matrixin family metalloprotease [Oligoflexia bacterium]|nr:matrixin family metalloprotease [Oligoflexia bacterium]
MEHKLARLSRFRGYRIIGCRVVLNASLKSTAKQLVGVMTHEMGHCLGLDHPQDTVNAIMSYFRDENAIRLNTDDKWASLICIH